MGRELGGGRREALPGVVTMFQQISGHMAVKESMCVMPPSIPGEGTEEEGRVFGVERTSRLF